MRGIRALFKKFRRIYIYVFLIALAAVMVFPLFWLLMASFKTDIEIFASANLLPKEWVLDAYVKGWSVMGTFTYSLFYKNTFVMVILTVIGTLASSILVGYGFARYKFPLKQLLFILVISGLLLPQEILIVPRFMMFREMGWTDSYKPIIIPAMFATYPFFVYMFIQFFRGVPRELDESAYMDGCSSFMILLKIIMPISKPAIFTAIVFQFIWRWNDFLTPLIYINSVKKYPIALILRTFIDISDRVLWNQALAMSMVSIIPPIIVFLFFQRYVVEGIATTGIKG